MGRADREKMRVQKIELLHAIAEYEVGKTRPEINTIQVERERRLAEQDRLKALKKCPPDSGPERHIAKIASIE